MLRFGLTPGPFTGAAVWTPTAAVLPDAVAVEYGGVSEPDWYNGAARRIADVMGAGRWICALHSGAGAFAPSLAEASASLAGFIFVDAVRPHPGRSLREVDARVVAWLSERAVDGRLPAWDRWFEKDLLARALPDRGLREGLIADLPRTPAAFLDAVAPRSDRWEGLPCAYLQLSGAYAHQANWAESRGWPVVRLDLDHLAIASHGGATAEALMTLGSLLHEVNT